MKKLFLVPTIAFLALTACNSKSGETTSETTTVDSTFTEQQVVDTVATVADTAAVADVVVNVKPGEDPAPTADKAAVIDFSAVWCGPCQEFKPIYHKVAADYASKATFYAADLDELKELGDKYKIQSIPCIVVLREGKEPVAQVGYMSAGEFKEFLDRYI
ncbi:MAG: thioredoxin family protein [Firmicutes bacterium]|nr:thioredoxin family protein [Bacillota bacterium]MCM1401196.1 thioredoxin family protein [Bacteroides sp.]MCM1477107.1 thioredoxin family protein [Bacteroides sp.]